MSKYEDLEDELETLRTPVDRWGNKYLGIAQHDPERIREIRKQLAKAGELECLKAKHL